MSAEPPLSRNHLILTDMKRKYCLVRTNGELSVNSFVYVVWAGSSLRESVTLTLVEEFCKDCGWYFKRWSPEVDTALMIRSKLVRVDGSRGVTPYQMISMSIQQCYDTIIDDSWLALEASHVMTPQETFWRFRNVPDFLKAYNARGRNTTCPPYRRKYLSRRNTGAFYGLCKPVAIIVFLIVLDAIVSDIISCTNFLNF